jgi:thioredoxin-like negative regulator of GroEL
MTEGLMIIEYDGTQDLQSSTVRFTADWCGPCQKFAPMFNEVANRSVEGTFVVVDVDKHPETALEFNVRSIPTVAVNGDKVKDVHEWAREMLA